MTFRFFAAIGAVVILAAACSGAEGQAPPITPETAAELSGSAVAAACDPRCDGRTIYVRHELLTSNTYLGHEEPMPDLVTDAIADQLVNVHFLSREEEEALFGDDGLVDGGKGVVVYVGPVKERAAGVVGIEIGLLTARNGGRFDTLPLPMDRRRLGSDDGRGRRDHGHECGRVGRGPCNRMDRFRSAAYYSSEPGNSSTKMMRTLSALTTGGRSATIS